MKARNKWQSAMIHPKKFHSLPQTEDPATKPKP